MVCGVCENEEEDPSNPCALKPRDKRRTTDCLFTVLIIVMWVAMTIVGAISIPEGNPALLVSPVNDVGSVCGVDPSVINSKYMYYVWPTGLGVCVEECPTETASYTSTSQDDFYCLSWLDELIASQPTSTQASTFSTYITGSCQDSSGSYDSSLLCSCNIKRASKALFNRCAYLNSDSSASTDDGNPTNSDYMKMWMADIITARSAIFGFGFGVAIIFSFLFTYLMSVGCIAYFIVWGCIIAILVIAVAMLSFAQTTLAMWKSEDPEVHTTNQKRALQIFVWCLFAIAVCWFLLMLWMCKAINIAIKCVIMGSKALDEMPMLVFTPVLQLTGFILFMIPMIYYCLYIASDGYFSGFTATVYNPVSTQNEEVQVGRKWHADHDDHVGAKLWFMFFCLLWTMNFIANFGSLVISHAVATWYFTVPEKRVEAISNTTIWDSYKLVLRFHVGTVALGSLLIALVQLARAVALYIQHNTSEKFRSQLWVKIVFCCINCCLACLECCMKFISKHAYIQTAIHGTPFCASGKNVFALIARNILRIGAIVFTAELCLLIGKLFVTSLATAFAYFFISTMYTSTLYDVVAPTVVAAIVSWMTASMFMDVLHMAVDTVLHCFIADEEHNHGVAVYASDDMKGFVDDNGKMEAPIEAEPEANKL